MTTLGEYVTGRPLEALEAADASAASDLRASWVEISRVLAHVRKLARKSNLSTVVQACDEVAMSVMDAVDRVSGVDIALVGKTSTSAEKKATRSAVLSAWTMEREALVGVVLERISAAVS